MFISCKYNGFSKEIKLFSLNFYTFYRNQQQIPIFLVIFATMLNIEYRIIALKYFSIMKKKMYDAPMAEVIVMELQGMIAASDGIGAPSWTPGSLEG